MIKKSGKKLALLAAAALMTISLAACSADASERDHSNLVVVTGGQVAPFLDPHSSNDSSTSLINVQIYETLVRQDESLNIVPGLALDWNASEDGRTLTFILREGVKFHNGDVMTAEDVKFSIERALSFPIVAEIVSVIDTVEVIDEHTVSITTHEPFGPILNHLAHPAASILSQADVARVDGDYGAEPVGTGPFIFDSSQVGTQTVLRANPEYWGQVPQVETLTIRTITEGSVRTAQLETNEADIALSLPSSDIRRLEENANVHLERVEGLSTNYLALNTSRPYLDNVLVRQAISYAIDMDTIMTTILENIGQVARGPIGPNIFGFNPAMQPYPYDVERARELMAEAGYADGFTLNLLVNTETAERISIATAVQSMLAQININVTIEQNDWPTVLQRTGNGEHDMSVLGWGTLTGDADYGLYSVFHSSSPATAGNRAFFANDRVDELLDFGRNTMDPALREQAYHEVQEIVREQAPWVFVNHTEVIAGLQNDVQGFNLNPTNAHRFNTVYFE